MIYFFPDQIDVHRNLHMACLAKISLLRSVVPLGNVILYRPSCSGSTRLAGFGCESSSTIFALTIDGAAATQNTIIDY
jgi:hypothetical protein